MTNRFVVALLALAGTSSAWAATPLIDAVKTANHSAVEELLKQGADVDAAESDGTTPLNVGA